MKSYHSCLFIGMKVKWRIVETKTQPIPQTLNRMILFLQSLNTMKIAPACMPKITVTSDGKLPESNQSCLLCLNN
jgi:hypothetical protein